ncbi:hypothetical protein H3H54_14535 [Brachybacterium sp. Z12]|uniref:hypothetical protein n=1 Tax=Brachybacterium sp. Z12 TaxID=2759167 RepID=UPI001862ECE0|nr:hypothetical protein [Brachybacterium sp. Z12]QNN82272.1 hypothetical protein H3H54_14535 [Brachybacterium sp. Z12]
MKFTIQNQETSTWTEISAERTDFDGYPPIPRFRVNWPTEIRSVDRSAVATSIIFAPWIAGRSDYEKPISALTAQRLLEWFQLRNIWTAPGPVRTGGLPLPRGHERLHLSGDSKPIGEMSLAILPSDSGSGRIGNSVHVATNAGVLMDLAPRRTDALLIRLGTAALLAESLQVNEIIDPEFAAEEPEEFHRAARLLECTALGLRSA